MIAPAAAPNAAPPTAFAVAALAATCSAPGPSEYCAYCRHETSSARNSSNLFAVPGSAMTAGPVGTITQPVSASAPASDKKYKRALTLPPQRCAGAAGPGALGGTTRNQPWAQVATCG